MPTANDLVRGSLKLDNFMEGKCYSSWKEFVQAIPSMFSVEVPGDITNVTVGNQQPTDDQRSNLWIRTDNSGSFLGLYLYMQGSWQQIYPGPNSPVYMLGDSRSVPAGYKLVTDVSTVTADQVTAMKKIWAIGGTSPTTWYTSFHVMYTGW